MTTRRFLAGVLVVLAIATTLRAVWLTADPPSHARVGVVWHDEGPWTHNARNRALWGVWRTDQWNPVFIAPVFTAFEYVAFRQFGVGTWQARTVPLASGLVALVALVAGLSAVVGRRGALIGGALLATNYVFVMWNRAALMESTMTMFVVVAWAAYAVAQRRPAWGLLAGIATVLAWFTKASAAFFVAAIVLEAALAWWRTRSRASAYVLAGLVLAGAVIGAAFVLPHWAEYRFYNWQTSVERKPSYTIGQFVDNASWLPLVTDLFTRMWPVMALGFVAIGGTLARWRTVAPASRLLVFWLVLGLAELIVHGAGQERYYVVLLPGLIALGAIALSGEQSLLPGELVSARPSVKALAIPIAMVAAYFVVGSIVRMLFASDIEERHYFRTAVQLSAVIALLLTFNLITAWRWLIGRLSEIWVSPVFATLVVAAVCGYDLIEYVNWAAQRTSITYEASRKLGETLPAETLVQGKMANALDLENRIRPVFIGREFGNYDDRFDRNDVRYILTYIASRPYVESSPGLIKEILDRYPNKEIVTTLKVDVDETGVSDRVALFDKFGHGR